MPSELWTKLIADAPILGVLLIVLWRGGEKLDKVGEKFDKMTLAVKNLGAKVELIGRLQDVRLDLHEERTTGTGKHAAINGAIPATRHPSWPDTAKPDDEE